MSDADARRSSGARIAKLDTYTQMDRMHYADVEFTATVIAITSIDSAMSTFDADVQITASWIDDLLNHNTNIIWKSSARKMKDTADEASKDSKPNAWDPGMHIKNLLTAYRVEEWKAPKSGSDGSDKRVWDRRPGRARSNLRIRGKFSCELNLQRFPFDKQMLMVEVGFHEPFYDPRKGSQPDDDATLIELAASIKAAEMYEQSPMALYTHWRMSPFMTNNGKLNKRSVATAEDVNLLFSKKRGLFDINPRDPIPATARSVILKEPSHISRLGEEDEEEHEQATPKPELKAVDLKVGLYAPHAQGFGQGRRENKVLNSRVINDVWKVPVHLELWPESIDLSRTHCEYVKMNVVISAYRNPTYYILLVVLLTFVVVGINASVHAVDTSNSADRLQISISLILTLVAYKFITADDLPQISYMTWLDKYQFAALMWLTLSILESSVVAAVLDEEAAGVCDKYFFAAWLGSWVVLHLIILGIYQNYNGYRRQSRLNIERQKVDSEEDAASDASNKHRARTKKAFEVATRVSSGSDMNREVVDWFRGYQAQKGEADMAAETGAPYRPGVHAFGFGFASGAGAAPDQVPS